MTNLTRYELEWASEERVDLCVSRAEAIKNLDEIRMHVIEHGDSLEIDVADVRHLFLNYDTNAAREEIGQADVAERIDEFIRNHEEK